MNSKIHLRKISLKAYLRRDSNPPVLAGNVPFLLNILLVFETLPFFVYISKPFCIISVLINSLSGSTADGCMELKPVFYLINIICHIDWRGKNQFIVGLPRCNMNSKVQILGKRKGFDGKKPK